MIRLFYVSIFLLGQLLLFGQESSNTEEELFVIYYNIHYAQSEPLSGSVILQDLKSIDMDALSLEEFICSFYQNGSALFDGSSISSEWYPEEDKRLINNGEFQSNLSCLYKKLLSRELEFDGGSTLVDYKIGKFVGAVKGIDVLSIDDVFLFLNKETTTEIYTRKIVGSVRCV